MRIWDLNPEILCREHLLGEHRELHAIWSVLTKAKKGYSKHPETLRWKGKLKALYKVHEELVVEMKKRGYNHFSPIEKRKATGQTEQTEYVDSPDKQIEILKAKNCSCKV